MEPEFFAAPLGFPTLPIPGFVRHSSHCPDQMPIHPGQRQSAAHHSISAVSRDARQNVFITEKHIKPNRLGRESPKVNSTMASALDGVRTGHPSKLQVSS